MMHPGHWYTDKDTGDGPPIRYLDVDTTQAVGSLVQVAKEWDQNTREPLSWWPPVFVPE